MKKEWNAAKIGKNLPRVFWLCAGICFAIVIGTVTAFFWREIDSERKMEEIRKENEKILQGNEVILPPVVEEKEDEPVEEIKVPNPYQEAFLQNEDMAAWLLVPNTNIDYPVMQTMEDEEYYIRRDFNGNSDKAGCLILDTDSTVAEPMSTNQMIHGHNMKAGTMFGQLDKYKEEEYYKEHSRMKLFTREQEHNYEVIAVFYSQVYMKKDKVFKYYKFFRADTEEEFEDFYQNIKKLSLYDTGVEATFGDRFLTLSTCSYHVEDGRFVVVAKEVEPGASYEKIIAPDAASADSNGIS